MPVLINLELRQAGRQNGEVKRLDQSGEISSDEEDEQQQQQQQQQQQERSQRRRRDGRCDSDVDGVKPGAAAKATARGPMDKPAATPPAGTATILEQTAPDSPAACVYSRPDDGGPEWQPSPLFGSGADGGG